jgi:hypothetical protein
VTIRGRQLTTVKDAKASLKGRSGAITRIKDEGVNIRNMTEPDGWVEYFEHYVESGPDKGYHPCTEDCEWCEANPDEYPSKRYLINAIDLDNNNKVIALMLPYKAAKQMMKKYDRYKTLLDRDYTITRDGEGFSTEYDVNPEPPRRMNLDKYQPFDLWELLEREVNGEEEEEEEDEPATPARRGRSTGGTARRVVRKRVTEDDDDEDEDDEPRPRRIAKASTPAKRVSKREPTPTRRIAKPAPAKRIAKRR